MTLCCWIVVLPRDVLTIVDGFLSDLASRVAFYTVAKAFPANNRPSIALPDVHCVARLFTGGPRRSDILSRFQVGRGTGGVPRDFPLSARQPPEHGQRQCSDLD